VRTWPSRLSGLRSGVDGLVIWEMLVNCSKVERGRTGKLRFCKVGHEVCLAANLAILHWTGAKIPVGIYTHMAPSVRMEATPL
jgi:hypothetical protein